MSRYTAQLQQQQPGEKMEGIAKSEGIEIEGCGVAGDIVQAAVGWLGIFYPSAFDLYLQCGSPCTIVTVQAPAGTTQADIDVCVDPGKHTIFFYYCEGALVHDIYISAGSGNTCVTVYAAPPCQPSIFALPISLQIPVGSSQVPVTLKLDIFGSQSCVAVEYNAPLCP